jgi:hypothetical protein
MGGNAVERRIAKFGEWIEEWRKKDGGSEWAKATEEEKLREIYWESCGVSDGFTVPGPAVLAAIEKNVDYAGLPAVQRSMLEDLRGRLDASAVEASQPEKKGLVGSDIGQIVDAGFFEEALRRAKEDKQKPWAGIPEDHKVQQILLMARDSGAWVDWDWDGTTPGAHVLESIEREVDYAKLAPWRRAGMENIRAQLDRGDLDGGSPYPSNRSDDAGYALRMAELKAGIEDYRREGVTVKRPVQVSWAELSEEEKLDRVERDIGILSLEGEAGPEDIIRREVDLARVPEDRRQRAPERSQEELSDEPEEPEHIAGESVTEQGRKNGEQETAAARLRAEWRAQVAFDRMVANLPRQWQEDGRGAAGKTWEELPADNKVAYLAEHAAKRRASFEQFVDAAASTLGLSAIDEFTSDDVGHLLEQYRETLERHGYRADQEWLPAAGAIANGREDRAAPQPNRFAWPGEPAGDRDGQYQVWHDRAWPQSRIDQILGGEPPLRFPEDYFHAADVKAGSLQEAVELTTSKGHVLKGDHQPWDGYRDVRSYTPKPFVPRDTDAGDVIVDPEGTAYRYDGRGFGKLDVAVESPSSFRESADGWDEIPTGEEWRKPRAEVTHDYGLRRMEDRGVKCEAEVERAMDHAEAPKQVDIVERARMLGEESAERAGDQDRRNGRER